jgi:predicted TIM-barrel fold metal-dependent hydrolase
MNKSVRRQAGTPLPTGGYVDSHRHLVQGDRPRAVNKAIQWMDERDIQQAVIPMAVRVEPGQPLDLDQVEWVLANYAAHPDRLFPMVAIHPQADDRSQAFGKTLRTLKARGFVGLGELKYEGIPIDDPGLVALYRAAGQAGLAVLIHIDATHCTDEIGLPGLERVLVELPDTRFIAHAQGWWAHISGDAKSLDRQELSGFPKGPVTRGGVVQRLLETYPNLYADLSARSGLNAIDRDLDHGYEFLNRFQDKLLFGTDSFEMPVVGTIDWGNLAFFAKLDLPQAIRDKIGRTNAQQLFGLPA